MKGKQYNLIGSNNFWYASCIKNKKEAIELAKSIMSGDGSGYGDDESGYRPENLPETMYVYQSKEVAQIEQPEED